MKYPKLLVLLLSVIFLAACGGGDETPVAVIKASVPHPVANAATVSGGSGVAVHMYQALYGMAPSNEMLLNYTAQATADPSTFARNLTSNFASTSSSALAKLLLDNLGVTATTVTAMNGQGLSEYAILLDALGQMFTFYGADARGQIILNATNLLAGLESDPTYGVTATSYNNQASANYSYSSNSANTVAAAISTVTANAGATQNVTAGTLVTLDGSASRVDPGRTLTYAWILTSKPAGSSTALSSSTSAKPTFTADVAGIYTVSLTVNDGKVNSTATTVTVTAAVANIAPVANAGVAQNVAVGTLVTLDGSASSDANSDPLTYAWTLTSKPAGSTAIFIQPTSVRPSLTADVAGTYIASLVVNDGKFDSNVGTVAITISQPAALSQSIDRAASSWAISSTTSAVDGKKTTMMVGKSGSYGTRFDIYCGSDGSKGYFISTDYITGSGYFKYRIGQNPAITQTWSESAGTGFKSLFPPSFNLSLLKQMYQNWDFSAQAHKYGAGYIDTAMDLSGFSAMIDKTRADCGWSSATFPPNNGWSNDYPDVPPSGAKEAIYVDGATEQFGLIAWRALNPSGQQQLLVRLGQNKSLCVGNVLIDDKRLYVEQDGKRVSAVSGTDFQLSCKNQLPVTFALQGNFDASRPFVLSAYPHHTNSLNPGQPISSVTVD